MMNACVLSIQAKPALRLRGSKPVARRARVASVTRAVISDPPPIKTTAKFTQDWALQVGGRGPVPTKEVLEQTRADFAQHTGEVKTDGDLADQRGLPHSTRRARILPL